VLYIHIWQIWYRGIFPLDIVHSELEQLEKFHYSEPKVFRNIPSRYHPLRDQTAWAVSLLWTQGIEEYSLLLDGKRRYMSQPLNIWLIFSLHRSLSSTPQRSTMKSFIFILQEIVNSKPTILTLNQSTNRLLTHVFSLTLLVISHSLFPHDLISGTHNDQWLRFISPNSRSTTHTFLTSEHLFQGYSHNMQGFLMKASFWTTRIRVFHTTPMSYLRCFHSEKPTD